MLTPLSLIKGNLRIGGRMVGYPALSGNTAVGIRLSPTANRVDALRSETWGTANLNSLPLQRELA